MKNILFAVFSIEKSCFQQLITNAAEKNYETIVNKAKSDEKISYYWTYLYDSVIW